MQQKLDAETEEERREKAWQNLHMLLRRALATSYTTMGKAGITPDRSLAADIRRFERELGVAPSVVRMNERT